MLLRLLTSLVLFAAFSSQGNAEQLAPTFSDVVYGDHPRNRLNFWRAASDKPTPVVVYVHGGSWVNGDKQDIRKSAFEKYLAAGISVVSINYRFVRQANEAGLKPPVKGPMHDAKRALQFVRSKATEWNIDKSRIGISGVSAGACTALWLTLHPDMAEPGSEDPVARESTRLAAAAVKNAQTSLDPRQMREWTPNSRYGQHAFGIEDGKGYNGQDEAFGDFLALRDDLLPWIREYSPYEHATPDDPPIYLYYDGRPALGQAQRDPTHSANFGLKLKEKLDAIRVPCELVYRGAAGIKHAGMEEFLIDRLLKGGTGSR